MNILREGYLLTYERQWKIEEGVRQWMMFGE